MAGQSRVRVTNLLLDEANPRLPNPPDGSLWSQRAILEHFAADGRVQALAQDIASRGLNPSKRPIVIGVDGSNRFVVLEGNRRLAAVKLLANPSLAGAPTVVKRFHAMADSAVDLPSHVECVVVDDRKHADHWIRIEHGLGKTGTSTLEWGPSEKSRYQQRTDGGGRYAKSTALVDALVEARLIDVSLAREVPITTLDRLLSDPDVRIALALDFEDLELTTEILPTLGTIVADLASGEVRVDDVRTKTQRAKYVQRVKESPRQEYAVAAKAKKRTSSRTPQPHHKRKHLIPSDFRPKITQKRLSELYDELRRLPLEKYPNAAAVSFRTFVEIAVWDFGQRRGWTSTNSLAKNVRRSAKALAEEGAIPKGVESVVLRAADDDESFLSVRALHQFVHGPYDLPSPVQLNRIWSGLQPYLEALIRPEQ